MDIKKIAEQLHTLERKVLPLLEDYNEVNELIKHSGLKEVEVIRALQWLENKEVLKINTFENKFLTLTEKARSYTLLPERILLNILKEKELSLEEIKSRTKLSDQEINASIGLLKKIMSIDIKKDKTLKIKLNENGKKLLGKDIIEEELFNKLLKGNLNLQNLDDKERFAFNELRNRGLVTLESKKERTINLTSLGKELLKQKLENNIIEALTPEIIRNKEWKNKKFRSYDIKINVPKIYGGRRHFVDQSIDYIKRIWLDMGFKEMEGNIVQTAFWDLDALFVPQDHSAREMQDTFYILDEKNKIKHGKIPENFSKIIKTVHENGWTTGSKGWGGKWKKEISSEVLLRTHTTVISALKLSKLKKEDLPAKFFIVGKVYRNESLDWKHLFEFYQVDGIVVDPNANFRDLLGYLKEFYKKMGYTDVKIKPSYFPYVEPGCEVFVFNPVKKQWIEVGGAGIFRPEVTKALLGFECPVLAWGQGMERIITNYYNITDLREIYKNDLKHLREMKEFLK